MNASFCHSGKPTMASYRYRCAIPAHFTGSDINNPHADVLVLCKPVMEDVHYTVRAHQRGAAVIVDVCDWHFDLPHYQMLIKMADTVTTPTVWMAQYLREDFGVEAIVIPDPFEFPEAAPHCAGDNCLWFGNATNYDSLRSIRDRMEHLAVVSNVDGDIPWSHENMLREFAKADIVVMPTTAPYKSANRTIEAIRQGCFVCAEPHPALAEFEGMIHIGSIPEGVKWAQHNPSLANEMTRAAQRYVSTKFAPQTLASAWRKVIQACRYTSAAEISAGPNGLASMSLAMQPM